MALADQNFLTIFSPLPCPNGIYGSIPPLEFASRTSFTHLHAEIFKLMISGEDLNLFKGLISDLDTTELQILASLLTSDSDYFTVIVTNEYGSRRVQELLGKSDDVDALLCAVILRCFLLITTDRYASSVTKRAIVVFDKEKKKEMYGYILYHALDLASYQHGCIALNDIIADEDDPYYKDKLLDLVAYNSLFLSNDASGIIVVQHVLTLYDWRTVYNIAFNLDGHFVDLSFKKYGSYIVEKLLEVEFTMMRVVEELLECDGDRLLRLARSEFGNFVVDKALIITFERSRFDLFWCLVQKLMPFLRLLRRSHGSNIANMLESLNFCYS